MIVPGGTSITRSSPARPKQFEPWPWTYADYRLEGVIAFLNEARERYRAALAAAAPADGATT